MRGRCKVQGLSGVWTAAPAGQASSGLAAEPSEKPGAARVGVGARHLARLFAKHLGATPSQVAKTARVQRAKRLLDGTDLPIGLLEGIVTWIRALVPPESQRAAVAIAREAERVNRAADALESAIARRAYEGRLNAAQIVLGTALGLVEPRLPVWKWREGRPGLSGWYDAIAARASFRMTEPPGL